MTPTITVALMGALTIVVTAAAAYSWAAARKAERQALRARLDPALAGGAERAKAPSKILREDTLSNIPSLNTLLKRFSPALRLSRLITQSGMEIGVLNIFYLMGFLALSTALLLQWHIGLSRPTAMLAGIVIGMGVPLAYIRTRRKKRLQAFVAQLPAALDMLRSSIRAGHSLDYALEVAVEELPDPIGASFSTVLEEMRLGLSPREALENLNRRVPVEELRFFILAVVLSREVGGNLSEVLTRLSETLRDRYKLRQQVRALSAQGRAAATLLTLIPPGVAFIVNLLRPGFVDPLFYHPTGRLLLGVAVVSQIAAILLIRKIVNPKDLGVA
jgi:tight adherence protein B